MSYVTLSWSEFLKEAEDFLQMSDHLGDTWSLVKKADNEGGSYLQFNQKVDSANDPTEMLNIEYHIVYSISYQVPVLYFQIYKSDGALLKLEEVWYQFDKSLSNHMSSDSPSSSSATTKKPSFQRADLLEILTQMEHPVLYRPFLAIHPCRTPYLLHQAGPSKNRLLTFISLMGPYVKLNLSNKYGNFFLKK